MRRVIEDELLTESGYRESLAEERVIKALAGAGAAPDALAILVDQRLLRIEERLDMRRVELMHDVLCSVVSSSRDLRHEREARDEAERHLATQREREITTRRALVRARVIAGVCAVMMVIAIAGAMFGWASYRRARVADAAAQQARVLAERARGDAERLVGFLIEDFYAELEPTGRLDTMGKLAHQAVVYYDGLPAELMTPQTQVYRGMALIREGGALLGGDNIAAGSRSIAQARELFEKLQAGGDKSPPVTYGRALALFTPFSAWGATGGPGSKPGDLQTAAELLRPLVYGSGGSRWVKITYADILNNLSHAKRSKKDAVAVCEEARKLLAGLGALDLSDLTATSVYADTADSQARHLMELGRYADAERLEREVYDLAERTLAKRPGDLRSMKNRWYAADVLSRVASVRHDYAAAARYAARSEQAGEDAVRFNPSDLGTWNLWVGGRHDVADILIQQGQVGRAIEVLRSTVALANDPRLPSSLGPTLTDTWFMLARLEAQTGQRAAAERSFDASAKANEEFARLMPEGGPRRALSRARLPQRRANIQLIVGEHAAAYDLAITSVRELEQLSFNAGDVTGRGRDGALNHALSIASQAALRLGRYAEAEAAARRSMALPPDGFSGDPFQEASERRVLLAHAIARQGRGAEAQTVLAPALEYYSREKKAGAIGTDFRLEFAQALYVSALAQGSDPAGRAAREHALAAAAQLLSGASAEVQQLVETRELSGWIAAARSSSSS